MARKTKVPHTYVIVFSIILLAAVLTWIIPPGKYVPVDGTLTFRYKHELPDDVAFKSQPQTWQVFAALFKGFVKQSNIIIFILMIGGAFWIMNLSKAIDVGIFSFLRFAQRLEHNGIVRRLGVNNIIMLLIMTMFSMFGAIFGMSEETIAFAIILIPLAISMGYDSIVGVGLVYVAAHLGFAGAILNPFTIGIAQGLAEIPLFSGLEYRLVCWAIINAVGFWYILRYAAKIKRNPTLSPVYEEDAYWRQHLEINQEEIKYYTPKPAWWVFGAILVVLGAFAWIYPSTRLSIGEAGATLPIIPLLALIFAAAGFFSLRRSVHYFILLLLTYTILFLIIGVMGYDWYVMEIATLFMGLGIASGIAIGLDANNIATSFLDGVRDILSAAIVVGLAGGIIVILEDGGVIDTILYGLSKSMDNFGQIASVGTMYLIQTIINIVIPSGSAKAAITMPIMAPFSDLIGVSRQATVMAFQFGDGFTNMITPTSGVLIAVLGVARIPYQKWVKWVWPLIAILVVLGFLLLIPTVTMSLKGF
ncbi:MAG: YfcC family protein [Bacteroidetes bacterium]|nr:YfcC family protein [Bacteroidota bacterium]